jgi:hypothetical protein
MSEILPTENLTKCRHCEQVQPEIEFRWNKTQCCSCLRIKRAKYRAKIGEDKFKEQQRRHSAQWIKKLRTDAARDNAQERIK